MNEKHTKRAGMYWVEKKPYISVTTILGIIDKSAALLYWACGETYDAVILNPEISREEAISARKDVSQKAMGRGSAIHDLVEAYENIGEVRGQGGIYGGYARAFQSWINSHNPKVIEHERTVISKKYQYAGTLDMLVDVGGKQYLIDVKTQKDGRLFQEIQLQLSAYKNALSECGTEVAGMFGLALAEDGTFTYKEFVYELEPFLSAKNLYEWKNRSSLIKMGYYED
ncbi:MAG: hypothetical protein UW63_C0087G0009 [Candidatus Uhrbacteria bacterium GW2011_GWF2_44_350]|uniref:PD-(D/E)XK endonuclease-like domain-containing protein n=1 Tax=Candidatus Uhrbacteria bacterium GW2011_GWF2_44_350 TaxID=1619000 RepID=A0A0G1M8A0_9BACT|nr:MAG: hypothetical protein UW63_C0087G0009 [Candidatus Uhrbacteria bacterium GW2011_GWF2_44_350]